MATLTGQSIANSYKDLLQVSNANTGIDGTPRLVSDGQGTDSILYLSSDKVGVGGVPTSHLEIISAGTDSQTSLVISGYNDQIDKNPELVLRKSHSDTVGTVSATPNDTILGVIKFSGVDSSDGYDNGVTITAEQNGSASTLVPTDLKFVTNGPTTVNTDQLVLHHDGGTGLGIDNPNGTLHVHTASAGSVNADSDADDLVVENDASGGITIMTPDANPGRLAFGSPSDNYGAVIMHQQSTGKLSINTEGATGNISMATGSGVEALVIDSSQNVGIGTGSDTIDAPLHVKGSTTVAKFQSSSGATNTLYTDSSDAMVGQIEFGASESIIVTRTSSRLSLGSNNVQTLHITDDDNVGIGSSSPQSSLVVSSGNNTGIEFAPDHSNTRVNMFVIDRTASVYENLRIDAETTTFRTTSDSVTLNTAMVLESDGTTNQQGQYTVNEQGRQNHVANTMSSPYYRFDGVDDYVEIADSDNLSFGNGTTDKPFSVSAWIYMEDASDFPIISKGIAWTGSPEWFFSVNGSDKLDFTVLDASASAYEKAVYNTALTSYENQWIHVLATYSGVGGSSANAGIKLYLNGTELATTLSDSGTYVAMENLSAVAYIGRYSADYGQGSIAGLQIHNRVLSATEVKELYSGMSVPFEYKGANQTNKLTGVHDNFDTNSTNHYAFQANYSQYQATGFTGSGGAISVSSNVMAMTGIASGHGINGSGLVTKGKKFRMTFNVTAITGNWYLDYYNQSESAFSGTGLKTVEWTAGGSDLNMFSAGSGGALTIDASSIVMELVPIGAVAEYDGSSAGEKVWGDKSGNSLDGTVSGATLENAPYDAGTEYEEGLWTPTLTTTGTDFTSVTYDALTGGKYVKVGNLVHVQGFLRTDAVTVGSASNNVRIGGLPYALENSTSGKADGHSSFSMGISRNWAGENPTRMVADANSSTIGLYYQEHNADYGIVVVADVGTGDNDNEIYFSGTYRT